MSWELLKQKLKNTSYQELYDEHYCKMEIEQELPKGKELQKRFFSKVYWKKVVNKKEKGNET